MKVGFPYETSYVKSPMKPPMASAVLVRYQRYGNPQMRERYHVVVFSSLLLNCLPIM